MALRIQTINPLDVATRVSNFAERGTVSSTVKDLRDVQEIQKAISFELGKLGLNTILKASSIEDRQKGEYGFAFTASNPVAEVRENTPDQAIFSFAICAGRGTGSTQLAYSLHDSKKGQYFPLNDADSINQEGFIGYLDVRKRFKGFLIASKDWLAYWESIQSADKFSKLPLNSAIENSFAARILEGFDPNFAVSIPDGSTDTLANVRAKIQQGELKLIHLGNQMFDIQEKVS